MMKQMTPRWRSLAVRLERSAHGGKGLVAIAVRAAVLAVCVSSACTNDGPAPPIPCEHRQEFAGGYACAVAPSATGAGIDDTFGYHAIGVPDAVGPSTPLLIYFKATGGLPFDAASGEYPGSSLNILGEAVSRGYLVLMVAYDKDRDIDLVCLNDRACYGAIRREIIEGVSVGVPGDAHTRPPDDIFSRIDALLAHLNASAPGRLPAAVDWPAVTLGGHSQGAGHAAYIAKELRQVRRACLFAGPGDAGSGGQVADWIAAPTTMTPVTAMRGVVHEADVWSPYFTAAWEALGMARDVNWRLITGPAAEPHNYVVQSAAASDARVWACFE